MSKLRTITQKEITKALATICLVQFTRRTQPMIQFNIENALAVFSIFTIVKRLENCRSIFTPYGVLLPKRFLSLEVK